MTELAQLLEATLNTLPEGVALLGENRQVAFWNQAAQSATGYTERDVIGRPAPETLKPLLTGCGPETDENPGSRSETGHGSLIHARHKLGYDVASIARRLILHDTLGVRIGTAVLFHPAECLEALPHGVTGESEDVEASQANLKDRLESLFEDHMHGGMPFGVLWITVDQAHELRRTHGAGACETMLTKVERALVHGLRPAEHLGRWGEDEFLVISHEPSSSMLASHSQVLAGLTRTADFRWWGDRVSLTVSIGAAQAEAAETLVYLLERARAAMYCSYHAGGNQITRAPEGHSCSPS